MAEGREWLARTGAATVTAALLLAGVAASALGDGVRTQRSSPGAGEPTASPASSTASPATAPAAPAGSTVPSVPPQPSLPPLMGAFTDSGPDGVHSLSVFQTWLGGTEMRVGHTYLPGAHWADIEGSATLLQPWADWKRADPDRLLVLNVPMQQDNEAHLSDQQVRSRIRAGASGAYDKHFTALARRLVALGVPDTVIVLGWEMNGTTYTHRCAPDPADWKTYWNRIVTAMRAVPGQHLRFDFAPNRGRDAIAWTSCYPGDKTVDIVGMDSYDQPPGESFYDQVIEPYGLQAQVTFAAQHHKPISYPEWGLFRNGDDPDYMNLMLAWITAHKPLYQAITDYCPHGVLHCTKNPKSSAVYRALLGTDRAAPAAPVESCVSVPLSDAMKETYDSGQVCMTLQPKKLPPATK
ncbi:Glycosyl hydrolase family 26 [Streptomyces sp. DvalAA-14]|uniref:glycoside hydrolase family 26 protein n=1 Tax=unclassified Streptomyces TaxID=2593676 RepID=UPI00081B4601|nr:MULTISPECIES: glycosyl hydrolase [unclassified Streptomyces]MYS20141.1 hypothetical protein [Streptomyces sp. SID4948]SCD61902.1 Glycosyl hydrolase family 26 [Streptomyces sp. DvalAA-14]